MPAPSSPGIVINTPTIHVAGAGIGGTIPLPTNEADQLNFILVQNASPFTLVLAQGQTLGQVAAFTGQVFPLLTTGQPVTFTPVASGGVIVPGTDSSIYATWYQQPPLGSWPASIGSGSVPFSSDTLALTGISINAGVGISPVFSALGYGGLVLTCGATGLNPFAFRLIIEWATDAGFANIIGRRQFVVGAGPVTGFGQFDYNTATMGTPHLGDFVRFSVVAPAVVLGSVFVNAMHRATPLSLWFPPPFPNNAGDVFGGLVYLVPYTTQTLAAGITGADIFTFWPYEGPVMLQVRPNYLPTATEGWRIVVDAVDELGNVSTIEQYATIAGVLPDLTETLIVPAAQLRVRLTNSSTSIANRTLSVALTADYSRMAA